MTPLKGADGQVYAISQGNVLVGGAGAASGGSSAQVNHLGVGRIPGRRHRRAGSETPLGQGDYVNLELNQGDFTTANRVVEAINRRFGSGTASASDARQIRVAAPRDNNQRVAFLSQVENLPVQAGSGAAKVIINARTGSVVMNQTVELEQLRRGSRQPVGDDQHRQSGQPAQCARARRNGGNAECPDRHQGAKRRTVLAAASPSLSEVVKALNAVGASPQDLLAILQAMKAAGALRADLEVI